MRTILPVFMLLLALSVTASAQTCIAPAKPYGTVAPATRVQNLTGLEFDKAYMRAMYEHRNLIISLADQELRSSNDKSLKELAGKIKSEQITANKSLSTAYAKHVGGKLSEMCPAPPDVNLDRYAGLASLQFDNTYTDTMIDYLQQAQDAAKLAMQRSTLKDLRDQARATVKAAQLQIAALRRWQQNLPVFE